MSRTSMKSVHVTASPAGKWSVRAAKGASETVYETQAEAIKAARESVADSGGQVSIHSRSGRVKISYTLGSNAMERLNAVEGLKLSDQARDVFREHDRRNLEPEQRRSELLATFGRKKA